MNKTTRDLIFIAFYVAMAVVLDIVSAMIPFLQMPQGGSINLAVIPVFVASYHLGWKKGVVTGLLWWLVGFLMGGNNWFVDPMQYALDYLIPAVICGLAAILPRIGKISNVYSGVVVMMILKFASHVLSGVYYWPPEGAAQGSIGAWTYSLGYNFYYNLATLIVAILVVPVLIQRLSKLRKGFEGLK
ncbi:MAG: energy-coupled thiamine transporter ThiT [Erysipelotrichaceae bacterium]|nr:energy-coupled thiamine transporter ThiT [Erysipelotrichaceae bacterium]